MLILLIGPKGSGKSHVGRVLEAELGVRFLDVEPLWRAYHERCAAAGRSPNVEEGIREIHPAIRVALSAERSVSIETTGASREILEDLLGLAEERDRLLVRITAPPSVCLERVAARNPNGHIPMDVESVRKVNEVAVAVERPFDLTIENVDLSDRQIARALRGAVTRQRR